MNHTTMGEGEQSMQALLAKKNELGKKLLAVLMAVVLAVGVALPTGAMRADKAWGAVTVFDELSLSAGLVADYTGTVGSGDYFVSGYSFVNSDGVEVDFVSGFSVSLVDYDQLYDGHESGEGNFIRVSADSTVAAGTYYLKVDLLETVNEATTEESVYIQVEVTTPTASSDVVGNRYYHLDFRISANVAVTVLNADGTVSTVTVKGAISEPSATIYNTSVKSWGTTHTWVDYTSSPAKFDISFKDEVSEDNGEYEYMTDPNVDPGRRNAEFYNGDTVVLSYTLEYTYNNVKYSVDLTESRVIYEIDNLCNNRTKTDDQRGFDISISAEDISSAMESSQLQINKLWNDNGSTSRPSYIAVQVYRSLGDSDSGALYMTLYLVNDADVPVSLGGDSTAPRYEMAAGITADPDMSVTFSDGYGATVTGLPQSYWVESGGEYSYVSCSYTVEEVTAAGNANFQAVYGSFVYVDDTEKNSYIVTITNTLAYEKLAVKKVWADSETDDHAGDSVAVKLSAYYKSDGVDTLVPDEWLADFLGGSTTLTLSDANEWYGVWGNMPVYYTLEDGTAYAITKFVADELSVTVDGVTTANGEAYIAEVSSISANKDGNGNYYFTVTNTPKPETCSVTIAKQVTGNMGDVAKHFDFTLTSADLAGQTVSAAYTAQSGCGVGHGTTITFDADGVAAIKLADDESVVISSVPIGSALAVTETNEGYSASVESTDSSTVVSSATTDDVVTSVTATTSSVADGLVITFTNDKSAIIDTGVSLDSVPFIVLLAGGLLGCLALAMRAAMKRKED